jgi:pilus assembly protein CpaE
MSAPQVIAVGAPPTFRQQVARALGRDPSGVEWMPSVTAVEGFLSEGGEQASVVVLSPVIKEADAFGLGEFVGRRAPGTVVVLVRERPLNGTLTTAMRSGIRDVVDLSAGSQDFHDALQRALAWSASMRSMGHEAPPPDKSSAQGTIVSVFSTKGGTGKTFLSCNLAVALAARSHADTAVVDFDIDVMGDVFSYFGKKVKKPLEDFLSIGDLDERDDIVNEGEHVAEQVWAYSGVADAGSAPSISGEAAGKLLRTVRSAFPFTVVDASARYSDHALAAFDVSDMVCLISGLDVVGIRHVAMTIETLLALGLPRERFSVVLNRADSKVGLTTAEVERVTKIRPDVTIPSSRLVPASLNKGHPVYMDEPKSDIAKSIGLLADKVIALAPAVFPIPTSPSAADTPVRRRHGPFRHKKEDR